MKGKKDFLQNEILEACYNVKKDFCTEDKVWYCII